MPAWNLASANGIGTSRRWRWIVASVNCISSLKLRTSRPAELVDSTISAAALNRRNDGARDVAGEDRLEPGMPAADQRQGGRKAGNRRELVEEVVFGSEQNRGPQDDGRRHGGEHQPLAGGLRARIMRRGMLVGAD